MATFETSDRSRLVDALNLDECLNRPNSLLASLMTNRENDDISYGVDRVADIKEALDKIECLQTTLNEVSQPAVKREKVDNHYEVEYSSGDTSAPTKQSKQSLIQKIKQWLDPLQQLEPYVLTGRVIRTL